MILFNKINYNSKNKKFRKGYRKKFKRKSNRQIKRNQYLMMRNRISSLIMLKIKIIGNKTIITMKKMDTRSKL